MIAVVVLTHNRVHLLERCVENVLGRASELTSEILIWDNGSTDGTREYLDSLEDPRLRVVHHPENIGQNAYARAVGLTSAEYVLELDDDVIDAPAHWDQTLLAAFQKLPRIGYLAANLVNNPHDQAARVMYVERPHEYTTVEVEGIPLVRGPVGGWCAITSRELLDQVGGFRQKRREVFWLEDEAYIEDIEKLGFEAALLKELKILHAGGGHYSSESEAKHAYWKAYWVRQQRKNAIKRSLLRIPFVRGLNARHEWFRAPEAPNQ
jgi:GT2 family glycosyltransferase